CRFHLIPYPLHRSLRWPTVAKSPAGIARRRLFPKVHPHKVEVILCIDNAKLAFMTVTRSRAMNCLSFGIYNPGLPSAQHHQVIRMTDHFVAFTSRCLLAGHMLNVRRIGFCRWRFSRDVFSAVSHFSRDVATRLGRIPCGWGLHSSVAYPGSNFDGHSLCERAP